MTRTDTFHIFKCYKDLFKSHSISSGKHTQPRRVQIQRSDFSCVRSKRTNTTITERQLVHKSIMMHSYCVFDEHAHARKK